MKFKAAVIATLILLSCSQENDGGLPTAPTAPVEPSPPPPAPPPPTSGTLSVWVMAVGPSDFCINGATVEIVRGQGLGQKLTQNADCGGPWDHYYGGVTFKGLTPGMELTLRASAAGYVTTELTIAPPRTGVLGPFMMTLNPSSP